MTHESEKGTGGGDGVVVLARIEELEAAANLAGWDEGPELWFICGDGQKVRVPIEIPNPPGEALARLAELLSEESAPARAVLYASVFLGPVAVAFVAEAWQNNTFTSEAERHADSRALADIPTSVEVRVASAVDLDGGYYWVNRVRGSEPTSHYVAPGSTEVRVGGRVFESLATIAQRLRTTMDGVLS